MQLIYLELRGRHRKNADTREQVSQTAEIIYYDCYKQNPRVKPILCHEMVFILVIHALFWSGTL